MFQLHGHFVAGFLELVDSLVVKLHCLFSLKIILFFVRPVCEEGIIDDLDQINA